MIPALLSLGLLGLAVGLRLWLPGYFLKRALARPFPSHFLAILEQNMFAYRRMPADLQQQLQALIKQFLFEKKFVGCDGLEVTDEVKVTIAGQACVLLLNRAPRVFPRLHMILVYPSAFIVPRNEIGIGGVVTHASQSLSGESWSDGRVILAWDHVMQGAISQDNGQNVVLHEFAHQLDSEAGNNNGAPMLPSQKRYRHWSTVLSAEFAALQQAVLDQADSVMDGYGATNPAEFFAVATETFFGKPAQMAEFHPALFAELAQYYRVDPREWH